MIAYNRLYVSFHVIEGLGSTLNSYFILKVVLNGFRFWPLSHSCHFEPPIASKNRMLDDWTIPTV